LSNPRKNADGIDWSRIDQLRRLEEATAEPVLAPLVRSYAARSVEALGELRAAVDRQDADAAHRQAHALRGASANLGAIWVADRCAEVELHARQGGSSSLSALVDGLEEVLLQTLGVLTAAVD
jgi:HPt (histidine-containing phosphotransfer) domain-containing protein